MDLLRVAAILRFSFHTCGGTMLGLHRSFVVSLVFLSGAFAAGCAGASGDDSESAIDEAEFIDTIVTIHADGTIEQSMRPITAEDRQVEQAQALGATGHSARIKSSSDEASALPVNPGCASADLWLYDSTQGNRLCISGAHLGANSIDSLDLSRVRYGFLCLAIDITGRCTQWANWAGRVRYIWPGINRGRLYFDPNSNPTAVFSSWGPFETVDPAMTVWVTLLGPYLG